MGKRGAIFLVGVIACVIACAVVSGCKKKPKDTDGGGDPFYKQQITKAPTPIWNDTKLSFKELGASATVTFLLMGLKYTANLQGFPEQTKVSFGGQEGTVSMSHSLIMNADIAERVGDIAPSDAIDLHYKFNPKMPMTLTFNGGGTITVDTPPVDVRYPLNEAMRKSRDTPFLFGASESSAPPPKEHTILLTSLSSDIFGSAKTMREVDWIAFDEYLTPRKGNKTCTGYKKLGGSGPEKAMELELVDREISIYDRRTAKLVTKKVLSASPKCPYTATGDKAQSIASSDDVKKWLREQRAKK